jgi:integrase
MADIRKREGTNRTTWQLRFKDPNSGKIRYKSFERRKDADHFLSKLSRSSYVHEDDSVTLAEASDRWLEACESTGRKGREPVEGATLKKYRLHADILKALAGSIQINTLTPSICDRIRDDLLRTRSRKYARKILASFKAILSQARSDGRMRHNPAENTAIILSKRHLKNERASIPSVEEVSLLLSKALELKNSPNQQISQAWARYYPFFLVLAYSGMRPGEVIGLPWKNVDLVRSTIRVTQDATEDLEIGLPKSASAYRTIHMPDLTMIELRKWQVRCPASRLDLVFPTGAGSVESNSNIAHRAWYPLQKACGLVDSAGTTKYALKSLRHVRASLEIHNGATAKELQALMGHSSVQITFDVYGHLFKDHEESRALRANKIADQIISCGKFVA